ncbi:MAG TPA: anhydro-N-acetylmuramic acid kinase [Candidatus Binataceae bacterium]|nr:anhydro-N-acetylmuramic acid kinase [Candidatus Binataceae bacterium]
MSKSALIVAGIMSGTSADGIDVALVRISGRDLRTRFKLLLHRHYPYPRAVRAHILKTMNAANASVADLARLNVLLGELYAKAVLKTQRTAHVKAALIGCHGQTLYHQGEVAPFLGRRIRATWQTGEAAILAARTGVPVVSDFRPADLAAGGKGAPLVPLLDYLYFRHPRHGRIVQNLGGIANLTGVPAAAAQDDIIAFDTGPGNMVIDAVTEALFGRPYDRDGRIASRGKVIAPVIDKVLRQSFFRRPPPRTAGREEFGRAFARDFIRLCRARHAKPVDVVATATALTAASIADAIQRFVLARNSKLETRNFKELILSGGGTSNRALVRMISVAVAPLGLKVILSDSLGLPSQAKEAVAFALLAYQTWNRLPGNLPSATGAQHPTILGKISFPS